MRAFLFTLAFATVHAGYNCSSFIVTKNTDLCPFGYDLAPTPFLDQCLADVCPKLSLSGGAIYADCTKVLHGGPYNGTCGPATPGGRMPYAAVCIPRGPGICDKLFAVKNSMCPKGTSIAEAYIVTQCVGELCRGLDLNTGYGYNDFSMMVVGRKLQSTCGPVKNNHSVSVGNKLCYGDF